ncbi:MAG: SRPBCC family protein [Janthinobacterium lividum]
MSEPQQPSIAPFPMAQQAGSRYFTPPDKGEDGEIIGHAVQTIDADAQTLFTMWSDLPSIPLWQEHVVSVTPLSGGVSHWVMGDPEEANGTRIEFDSETTEIVPGKKIAWRSITEGVKQSGVVTFEETARGTRVTLIQTQKVPGGSVGNAVAGVVKRTPRQTIIEDLRHFKQMAEAGEIPSVAGQPHGTRGITGTIKEWMYGEKNPTPPGSSQQ